MADFSIRKAAQVAAFFALKSNGQINVLKLTKLAYLADREFMSRYDEPLLFDCLVSMPHGPVDSLTYNYIRGDLSSEDWSQFISDRDGYSVGIANSQITFDNLDEFSDAEFEVLETVWRQFGHFDKYQLRDYTHCHCPEWEDPHGSSNPIPYERVFKFLGKSRCDDLEERIEGLRSVSRQFA